MQATPLGRLTMLVRELGIELDAPLKEATRQEMVRFKTTLMVQEINQLREAYNLDLYSPPAG